MRRVRAHKDYASAFYDPRGKGGEEKKFFAPREVASCYYTTKIDAGS